MKKAKCFLMNRGTVVSYSKYNCLIFRYMSKRRLDFHSFSFFRFQVIVLRLFLFKGFINCFYTDLVGLAVIIHRKIPQGGANKFHAAHLNALAREYFLKRYKVTLTYFLIAELLKEDQIRGLLKKNTLFCIL